MLIHQAASKQSAAVLRRSENKAGQDKNILGYSYTTLHSGVSCFYVVQTPLAKVLMKNKQTSISTWSESKSSPNWSVSTWQKRVSQQKELCHSKCERSDSAHNVFYANPNHETQCIASGNFNWLLLGFTWAKVLWKSEIEFLKLYSGVNASSKLQSAKS